MKWYGIVSSVALQSCVDLRCLLHLAVDKTGLLQGFVQWTTKAAYYPRHLHQPALQGCMPATLCCTWAAITAIED